MMKVEGMDSVFRVDGFDVTTSPCAAGPWDATMQHGGAPAALMIWAAEQLPSPVPMRIARLTLDMMRPVPVAPLRFERVILRQGRKIQLCELRLLADDKEVALGRVLRVRHETQDLPNGVAPPMLDVPLPEDCKPLDVRTPNAFTDGLSLRSEKGGLIRLGGEPIWFRIDRSMIAGEAISQAMRAVVAADFSNTSTPLDFNAWRFLNADLTVHLAREPVGDWVLMNAESWVATGGGIACSRLGDSLGYFGRAIQSLVVEPR